MHRLLSEHLTAECKVHTEGRGRVADEWKPKPNMVDNHWLDGLVGCAVGASLQGVSLAGTQQKVVRKENRLLLSEIRRQRRM